MPTTTHFGCRKCTNIHFSTLDLALQHLRRSPVHHADTLELIEKFDSGYRVVAARTLLFSFSINSESEHDAAIEEAELQATAAKAGVDAALRAKRAASLRDQRMGEGDDMGVAKRTCRGGPAAGSCVDNSTRTQSSANCSNVNATVFTAPITVRVKLCSHVASRGGADVFKFAFARDKHTTLQKLLDGVAASYREERGEEVDLENRRLVMHLSKKGVVVGGVVGGDEDVMGLSGVQGPGWFGQMKFE